MKIQRQYIFIFLFPLYYSNGYSQTAEDIFKKQIPVQAGDLVSIYNVNGDISVETWDQEIIKIVANKKAQASSAADAQKLLKELKIDVDYNTNKLTVKTVFPSNEKKHGGFFSWLFCSEGGSASVRYVIKTPENINLNLHSTNGNINVQDCSGKMRFETTNGNIISENISGAVRCNSINGSLKIYFKNINDEEDMEFKTTNGTINLYFPEEINAFITARTMNGIIQCVLPLTDVYEESSTRLEGTINSGGPHIVIKTTNGNININEN